MAAAVALLRGINLGPNNRIAMPELRAALADAGLENARTYVQSGNIVLDGEHDAKDLAATIETLIAERFGLTVPVLVRTRDELAGVVRRNPLAEIATERKRYHVVFLSDPPAPESVARLEGLVSAGEAFAAVGRELYIWYGAGSARSKLALAAVDKRTGVTATARNWTTVTTLLEMAGG